MNKKKFFGISIFTCIFIALWSLTFSHGINLVMQDYVSVLNELQTPFEISGSKILCNNNSQKNFFFTPFPLFVMEKCDFENEKSQYGVFFYFVFSYIEVCSPHYAWPLLEKNEQKDLLKNDQ